MSPVIFTRNLSRGLPKLTLTPAVSYENAGLQKQLIFNENKDKSFVYRWTNKKNGKQYLGSTSNGKRRLLTYYDDNSLKLSKMPIYSAILKYGRENFLFEIIEYCKPEDVIQREQYYLDRFDFDYNILEKANSLLGYKHTEETLAKMKGRKNALGYKHSPEILDKLREYQLNKKHSIENIQKMRDRWSERKLNTEKKLSNEQNNLLDLNLTNSNEERKKIKGKSVVVTNIETKISTEYISISEAALALDITRTTLRSYIKNNTIFSKLEQDPLGNGVIKKNFLITVKDE